MPSQISPDALDYLSFRCLFLSSWKSASVVSPIDFSHSSPISADSGMFPSLDISQGPLILVSNWLVILRIAFLNCSGFQVLSFAPLVLSVILEVFCNFTGCRRRSVCQKAVELTTFCIPSEAWALYSVPKGSELVLLSDILKSISEAVTFVDWVF